MEKESKLKKRLARIHELPTMYPLALMRGLLAVAGSRQADIYLVGGTLRDWLLRCDSKDLDLTVDSGCEVFCRALMRELGGGAYVPLGTENEAAGRVVWEGLDIDISEFRGDAGTIEDDLQRRDFTINTMAVSLPALVNNPDSPKLIDPLGGCADLIAGRLRHCPNAFIDDPLRLLRGFRFMATRGFRLEPATREAIEQHRDLLTEVAAERIRYELDLILESDNGAEVLWQMHEAGLLYTLLPELYTAVGVEQPNFHHLDVFHHSFLAMQEMERLLQNPERIYPGCAEPLRDYLQSVAVRRCLKWSALLHDIGKPAARDTSPKDSRVTFYGHDELGRDIFLDMARRLKWNNDDRELTGRLIAMHMHPFHLCNVMREKGISRRAALKICSRAGGNLPGLFLLAMADSLASKGDEKPVDMEGELVRLYDEVWTTYKKHIQPVLSGPPLLGGRDLIEHFSLTPGPIFSRILSELQAMQVEGGVADRKEALCWVAGFLENVKKEAQEGCK